MPGAPNRAAASGRGGQLASGRAGCCRHLGRAPGPYLSQLLRLLRGGHSAPGPGPYPGTASGPLPGLCHATGSEAAWAPCRVAAP